MIYITGYRGRLGSQLISMGCRPLEVDVSREDLLIDLSPENDIIVNCAAKTDVDRCEHDQDYYWKAVEVNGYGTRNLADGWKRGVKTEEHPDRQSGKIIHISTDYVFGGKNGPYSESFELDTDVPTRRMSYAVTKFMGELYAKLYDCVYIVRTTGLYGGVSPKNNFLNMILDNFSNGVEPIYVTNELRSNQTYVPHFAEALLAYCQSDMREIIHIASKEVISRYEFAFMIAEVFGLDGSKIIPCRNDEVMGWLAERPKKAGLKTNLASLLGLPIYSIIDGLKEAKRVYAFKHNYSLLQ